MMNQIQRYNLLISFLIFQLITRLTAEPISSFSLKSFNDDKDSKFTSDFILLGDAQIANEGSFVNLTSSSSGSSFGQLVYNKPFNFLDSKKPVSFFTEFTFTITPSENGGDGNGNGMAFVIFPSDVEFGKVFDQGYFGLSDNVDRKFVAVEYDVNGNHVGVDVSSFVSAEISDVSSIGLVLNNGVSLKSWISYDASSKRLEIRLAKSGSERPYITLLSYPIDLLKMWGDKDVMVGISSSSGNSSQITSLSSWSFELRTVSSLLHSEPMNVENVHRRKNCFLTVLGGVIFATGCGTMVAFLVLFLWVIFFGRHSNVVPEVAMNPIDFKYEKVNVTVDNVADDSTRLSTN